MDDAASPKNYPIKSNLGGRRPVTNVAPSSSLGNTLYDSLSRFRRCPPGGAGGFEGGAYPEQDRRRRCRRASAVARHPAPGGCGPLASPAPGPPGRHRALRRASSAGRDRGARQWSRTTALPHRGLGVMIFVRPSRAMNCGAVAMRGSTPGKTPCSAGSTGCSRQFKRFVTGSSRRCQGDTTAGPRGPVGNLAQQRANIAHANRRFPR